MHAIDLSSATDDAAVIELRSLLIGAIGHRSILQRYNYLEAAVERRRLTTGAPCYSSYLDLIRTAGSTTGEFDELIKELTIGETAFFRYQENFAALRAHFKALHRANPQETAPIRVWSAGCSNGAEAYSVLILARNMRETGELTRPVEVIGTDINRAFLREARKAAYRKWTLRSVDPETIPLWFETRSGEFVLREKYRAGASFLYHNLLTGSFPGDQPEPARFDAILCCNVMIYFDTGENSALLGGFSKVLRPDGLFLTGPVDYFPRFHDFFDTQKLEGTHVYRHRTAIKIPSNEHCIASVAKPAASNDRVNGDARSHPVRQIETPAASEPQQPDDPLRGALRAKLFRERSICLASRKIPLPAPETMEKLLVLRIGAETLCLRISRAAAVFQANAIALVPGAASSIAGLQMWRGHIMTLIDLAALLGIPDNPAKAPDRIAIELRELSPRAALLVDAIEGTVELDLALLEPASGSAPGSNFMLGRAERQHFIIDDDAMVAALPTGRHDHRAD